MQQIISTLAAIKPLSPKIQDFLEKKLKNEVFAKKSMIVQPETVNRKIYFIEKGIVRAYFIENGKEHTTWFFKEADIIISVISFFLQKPSNEYIETLEDCVMWSLSYTDLQFLYDNFPEFNYVGRVLTEKYYCLSEIRNYNIRMKSVNERYVFLQQQIPDILHRVPVKHIASHLEIEPETLSRLRVKK
ncbi:Crp/Fnr family transcriptional regulator [Emticicia sp. 21SJ11W-3]|uniref:Crp/Fnr family transcriptional regulator n=1 Tax=Emticicia sp. 21SJ11W-3 TaxID=2916755 RepID=UPI00209C9A05|nr:Crp/Fnr family transcriptional regulator [Emticicia sp. 21SJ11W-3]UTA70231.1 Crp/Fnr family transcriptional regulator [Emticicia sp. 21SJ11W-3]